MQGVPIQARTASRWRLSTTSRWRCCSSARRRRSSASYLRSSVRWSPSSFTPAALRTAFARCANFSVLTVSAPSGQHVALGVQVNGARTMRPAFVQFLTATLSLLAHRVGSASNVLGNISFYIAMFFMLTDGRAFLGYRHATALIM